MSKEIYISSTPHETRLAIVEKDELTEIYYERENEYTLAGSIYNGRVTRVLPGMQSSFVDIGLERDAFLYITDFMEEAGDAADFDAAGSGEARAPRGERPKAESGGEARSEGRGEGRSEGRGEGRGEGRSEGRGRGRRDGRGGERRPREAQPEARLSAPVESPVEEVSRISAPNFAAAEDESLASSPRESEGEEIGEGAPGADGSRRWRGRRGRRRGRGLAGEQQTDASVTSEPDEVVIEAMPQEARAPRDTSRDDSARVESPRTDSERRPVEASGDRGPREGGRGRGGRERGGRDRGGRDRDRGADRGADRNAEEGGGRDNRQDAVRERFAPRGARPASSGDEVIDLSASAEPFILPGESLSKYRKGENGGGSEPAAAKTFGIPVTAKPSTEIAPLVGWDGGAVLPGETLRAREPRGESRSEGRSESRNEPRSESRNEGRNEGRGGDRGRDRRRGRDEQRGRGGRDGNRDAAPKAEYSAAPRGIDPAEAVLPAVTSQHDVVESEYEPHYPAQTDLAPVETNEPVAEHEAEFEAAVGEHRGAEALEAEAEFHETTMEYEPEENASASFRVDPAGQREFRQSSLIEERGIEEPVAEETHTPVMEHEFTTLQPTGELISEVAHTETKHADPTAPIEHETVVQSVHLEEAEKSTTPFEIAGEFAPGDGQLEEEVMEEEESEISSMHASAFDDDSEEETLEGAADLGSMIRDMTIDDITRREPAEVDDDDEEDFEGEEDFEEDELASTGDEDFEEDEVSGSRISEGEEEEYAEAANLEENRMVAPAAVEGERAPREGGRRGRRDGRRGGRERSGGERSAGERGGGERSGEGSGGEGSGGERSSGERSSGERGGGERGSGERSSGERSSGERGSRDRRGMANSRGGGRERGGRSMQSTNLPAISDLLKPGQEILVQIAKEPMAKKGARITSHIALPGRFLVFMPTVNHTGVSRKIESDGERRRLKEILLSEKGDAQGGFIVRTAASGASEEELRSDLRFLLNLWADIKARSESSKSPALIYHDLNLIERILRDQVTDNFSAIWVDTEAEYERVLRFLQRFQPSLIRRVKLYTKDTPLFEQFGITEEINKALRSKVWLKSGGSIVINQTEALVAIDINTGKYVGKTARLEDTIVKTNLDAIPEIVRQIRLRDLGGIIIIDFIDMDERKNRNKVMAALEEELKSDRAPSKVLQFNDFGLVAITRKRVKQSLERTLSTTCGICAGTGMVKSPVTVCNDIYIEMRKMHKLIEKGDIMLRVNPEVVKQLKTGGAKWLQEMEEMSGKTILVKSDPSLHPEQFDIH
jgi:ribonuclease E